MALLLVGVVACLASLWFLWETAFDPEPSNYIRAGEVADFVLMVQRANLMVDAHGALKEDLEAGKPKPTEPQVYPKGEDHPVRVRGAGQWLLDRYREPEPSYGRINSGDGLANLVDRQETDVRQWRRGRIFFVVLPLLAVGAGTFWFGLRVLRRLRLPGTVFEGPSQPAATSSPKEADEETQCLECGKKIPAGASRCPGCGWSYLKA
jgi:hypothetical protein